jgi:hypothetical protein
MISIPTVIVLGAGASKAVKFPTNPELIDYICEHLKSGQTLNQTAIEAGFDSGRIENFRQLLYESHKDSIDSFLELQRGFLDIGRFAIATAISAAENHDTLMTNGRTSWYRSFLRALGNDSTDAYHSAMNLKILTFNYDRSLEHFIFTALNASAEPRRQAEVTAAVANLHFHHLHGSVGPLPSRSDQLPLKYGAQPNGHALIEISRNILLAHELRNSPNLSVPNSPAELTENAERVFFFGFAFHNQNLSKLGLFGKTTAPKSKFFASDVGLSSQLKTGLGERLNMQFFDSIDSVVIELGQNRRLEETAKRHAPIRSIR